MSDAGIPPPPATFEFLVLSLRMQADLHLGLMGYAKDEAPAPNLPAARHVIDLLAMLLEKTRGNLELAEQRLVENSLTELRFRFVQVSESAANAASATGSSSPAASEAEANASPSEGDAPGS